MRTFQRHNPALLQKLNALAAADDADGLRDYLLSLSASTFRTAGSMLADEVLPAHSAHFWHLFSVIVPAHAKAFLGPFLKVAVALYKSEKLALDEEVLTAYSLVCSHIDKAKLLQALLPCLRTEREVFFLFDNFCDNEDFGFALLIKSGTMPCYYTLFNALKCSEEHHIKQCAAMLMKKGDSRSFNLACILKQYFGLADISGQFSLRIQDYELSRLDQGYDYFVKMMNK